MTIVNVSGVDQVATVTYDLFDDIINFDLLPVIDFIGNTTIANVSGVDQVVAVTYDLFDDITNFDLLPVIDFIGNTTTVGITATTNTLTVNQPVSSIVTVTAVGPQGARVDLIAPVATYGGSGNLTEINYSSGFRKVFAYDGNGYLSTVTFYQPSLPTTRKTLTWANGQWQSTSAPEVI